MACLINAVSGRHRTRRVYRLKGQHLVGRTCGNSEVEPFLERANKRTAERHWSPTAYWIAFALTVAVWGAFAMLRVTRNS